MKRLTLILLTVVITSYLYAQMPKGRAGVFALTNATIETVSRGTIQNGTLIIADGKIYDLGVGVDVPSGAEIIDCSGWTVYPGFIDAGTQIGLVEVGSDPRTRDNNEIGEVIPHVQALTAVNPNSVIIPVTRVSGVTTALTMPSGGLFPGTAALINLHGYTPDQMYAGFKGMVLNFPATGRRSRWDQRSEEDIKKAAEKALKQLNDVYAKALLYHKIDSLGGKQDYYPEMEALLPVVRGEMKLLVQVNTAADIQAAMEWIEGKNLDVIFCGVAEGWRVADKLAEANIPVVTGPVLGLPTRAYDRYDKPYANAGIMHKAGVKIAIRTSEIENVRNLPYNAGFAATYGMGRKEALRSITITPAEILGVDAQYGSLEKGKIANLFVADGDPFETKTKIKHVFIHGWSVPMVSRHTQLYDEFLERTPGISK